MTTAALLLTGPLAASESDAACIRVLGREICFTAPIQVTQPGPGGSAQTPSSFSRSQTKQYKVGTDKYASAELRHSASIFVNDTSASSVLSENLRGCFANRCTALAEGSLTNEKSATRVSLRVGGKTVYSTSLGSSGSLNKGPFIVKVGIGGKLPIVPGLVSAFGRADIGAGTEFAMNWSRRALPPQADLTATAKAFGNGRGEIGLSALDIFIAKLASASLQADLRLLNPTASLEAKTSLSQALSSRARVIVEGFKLYLKGKVQALCARIPFVGRKCAVNKSTTLINTSGGKKTFTLFGAY